jgi:hypothetical protein
VQVVECFGRREKWEGLWQEGIDLLLMLFQQRTNLLEGIGVHGAG